MAATVLSAPGSFDAFTRDRASLATKLARAVLGAGNDAQRATARAELYNRPDFLVDFTTPDNGALNVVLDLTDRGVTFPAATLRTIKMVMRSSNDADTFFQTVEQDVYGNDGVTPVLGDQRLVKACMLDAGVYKQMGRVQIHTVVAVEATDGTHSSGTALAAFSSGTSALSFPPSRAVGAAGSPLVMQDAFEAGTSPSRATIAAISASAGTATLVTALGSDGTAVDPPASNDVYGELFLWPVAQCALVLATADVQVHARTTLSDVFTHRLQVFVGKIEDMSLGA